MLWSDLYLYVLEAAFPAHRAQPQLLRLHDSVAAASNDSSNWCHAQTYETELTGVFYLAGARVELPRNKTDWRHADVITLRNSERCGSSMLEQTDRHELRLTNPKHE